MFDVCVKTFVVVLFLIHTIFHIHNLFHCVISHSLLLSLCYFTFIASFTVLFHIHSLFHCVIVCVCVGGGGGGMFISSMGL